MDTSFLLAAGGVAALCLAGVGVLVSRLTAVGPDEALILTREGQPPRVVFGPARVLRGPGRAEVLDLSVRKVGVDLRGRRGLSCQDGIRVDVRATFQVKVERKPEAVLRVVREVGCERANRPEAVQALLEERLAGALASSAGTFGFDDLLADRSLFTDHVGIEAGGELLGFKLERVSLGRLERTPLDQLDPTDVRDAQGILKLTERSARVEVEENERRTRQAAEEVRERVRREQEELVKQLDRLRGETEPPGEQPDEEAGPVLTERPNKD